MIILNLTNQKQKKMVQVTKNQQVTQTKEVQIYNVCTELVNFERLKKWNFEEKITIEKDGKKTTERKLIKSVAVKDLTDDELRNCLNLARFHYEGKAKAYWLFPLELELRYRTKVSGKILNLFTDTSISKQEEELSSQVNERVSKATN